MTTTYQYALKRSRKVNGQVGGNPAAVLGVLSKVNDLGKTYKPATKLGDFLEKNVSDAHKKKTPYKIVHGLSNLGKKIGWGKAPVVVVVHQKKTTKRETKK